MQIGYTRVSKADGSQVLDLQRDAMIEAGVEPAHLYEDRCSGSKDERPGLDACLKSLCKGDVLVIWKLDRLGRNLKHLIETVDELSKRGVGFKVLRGNEVDTSTPAGKLSFRLFAMLAEFERDTIRERTVAGLASARARGRVGGRKPKMTAAKLRLAQAGMQSRDTNVAKLCEELGVTRQTIYRHIGPDGTLRPDGEKLLAK
jgi:DNA invertase Pin-like site-specific DNA recombinase